MTTENTTPETTEAQMEAAVEAVTAKVATFGGLPAAAWDTVQKSYSQWPEDVTELTAAKKVVDTLVGMFPELADAWAICRAASKKPAAPRKVAAGRTPAAGPITPSEAAKLAAYLETGMKYFTFVAARLRGEEPTPIRDRSKKGDDTSDAGDEDNDGDETADDAAPGEVAKGLDDKSAAALGATTSPPTAEALAAVAAQTKHKPKK